MTLGKAVCPICGKEFETLALMVSHVDDTYPLTRIIEELIKAKDTVPVSKIEALPYDDWCFCRTCLGVKDLLTNKEKEKPEE